MNVLYFNPSVGTQSLLFINNRGGKSGLHRAGSLLTEGRGDPMESATENIPLSS